MIRLPTTVVVTVLNEVETAGALIDALVGQARAPDEIIVVDGGSTDGTFESLGRLAADHHSLRVVSMPGTNIAEGRNRGIELARNEIIACTDAGCRPQSDWLERIVAPFADGDIDVVGGAYAIEPKSKIERVVGLLTMPGQLIPFDPARFNPSARSIAFRRAAWRRAGGFPTCLHTAEDTLFDCKLRRLGCRFTFADDAVVRWRPRSSLGDVYKQFRDYARGEARIGRGDGNRFWIRRYIFATLTIVAGLLAPLVFGSMPAWIGLMIGLVLSLGLLVHAAHDRADRIRQRTRQLGDYVRAVFIQHCVAIATVVGHRAGRIDRRRDPARFVSPLIRYWGEAHVSDAPPWRMKNTPAPRTLIISWHWPPANRASASVIANLFRSADERSFSAITRDLPAPNDAEQTDPPPIPTARVGWLLSDDCDRGWRTWLASMVACVRMVLAARRMHRIAPYRKIMGIYPHKFGILAAWLTSCVTGAPLVLWMHDLFAETLITNSRIKRAFWTWVDRKALARAELILTPTREFADHYKNRGVNNVWVLPHCRDPRILPAPIAKQSDVLRIAYSGSAYQAHLDGLRDLIGTIDVRSDARLDLFTNPIDGVPASRTKWLSRADVIDRLSDCDLLAVVLGRDTPYPAEIRGCFPSKIVDYLAVGRPILAIVPPGSFVERLIRESGCGVAVTSYRRADINNAIDRLLNPFVRQDMARRAVRLGFELSPSRWMNLLCERLTADASSDAQSPRFPSLSSDTEFERTTPLQPHTETAPA